MASEDQQQPETDDWDNFIALPESAFEFWNDPADDIYEKFYKFL